MMKTKLYHCKAGEMKIYQIRNIFSERGKKSKKKTYQSVVSSGIRLRFQIIGKIRVAGEAKPRPI